MNKAECRESTLQKQRAQHSGLLNHLSYCPGEKEFATESHKWTEFACLKPVSPILLHPLLGTIVA